MTRSLPNSCEWGPVLAFGMRCAIRSQGVQSIIRQPNSIRSIRRRAERCRFPGLVQENGRAMKILVPTDYSACSLAAIKHAASVARESNADLLILHVVLPDSHYLLSEDLREPDPLLHDYELLMESLQHASEPLHYEERRIQGLPVSAIIETARQEEVDLIVMGTLGRTGLKRMLLGSVAEEVIRRSPCPVLTLKAPPGEQIVSADSTWERLTKLEAVPPIPLHGQDRIATDDDNPTIALLSRAIIARASDVHIDPAGEDFVVRFRIDGRLNPFCRLSHEVGRALLTQLKVVANVNIADPFHPKEGRLQLPETMRDFEVRLTAVPILDGEAVSLRILNRHRLMRPIAELGMVRECQLRIERILARGQGLVLVTGPTGSGKTTTLYSMLHVLDDGTRNIVSIEDPVEFDIPTFRQLPVDPRHGLTMNSGLKTLMRLDPDIILVGEIRDAEAAETAMRAASSGKLVLSSLHTRDVASTVTAVRDLHIDNQSLAGNLIGIISQRLIRRLCPECSSVVPITEVEASAFHRRKIEPPTEIHQPVGCSRCRGTGYFDRIGVFEVVTSEDEIMRAIEDGEPEDFIREAIRARSMGDLESEVLRNISRGTCGFEEYTSTT